MFTAIDLDYIQILLPIIFFTIVLLFVSNSSLFNPDNNNVKKSLANSFLLMRLMLSLMTILEEGRSGSMNKLKLLLQST